MPLPNSGAISLSQVNVELGRAANAPISLGEAAVRNLAGIGSGAIGLANLHGKSAGSLASIVVTPGQYSDANYLYKGFSSAYGIGARSPTTAFTKSVAECFIGRYFDGTSSYNYWINVGLATGGGAGAWDSVTSVSVAGVVVPCRFSIDKDVKDNPMGSHTLAPDATPGLKFWPLPISAAQFNTILAAMNAGQVTFSLN